MELNDLSTIYVRFYIVVLLYTINRDRRTFFAKYTCLALNLLTKGNSISRCSELQYCGGAVPGDQFAGRHMCATCSGSNYICIRNVGTTCALSIVNLYFSSAVYHCGITGSACRQHGARPALYYVGCILLRDARASIALP